MSQIEMAVFRAANALFKGSVLRTCKDIQLEQFRESSATVLLSEGWLISQDKEGLWINRPGCKHLECSLDLMDNGVDDPLQSVKPSIHPLFVSFELGVFGVRKLLLIQQLCDFRYQAEK